MARQWSAVKVDMRRALPHPLLSVLSDFVARRIGLYFPEERWGDLERGIAAAARELGHPDAESCANWVVSAPLARNHIEVLASHLTVGETYFFREQRSLEVFEEHIVPALLRSWIGAERRLRIWSAGCCTGEEPYSIAMLLDKLIPNPEAWNVTLLATDINPRFLRKAAQGVYGEWSFRGTPAWVREQYFKRTGNGRWELCPRIRNRVTFSYLNLADDVYPSLLNTTNAMDVIFCRNVLMYFTAERAKEVSRNLHLALVDGGWLVVSPTETSNDLFASFSAVQFPGVVLYRKIAGAECGAIVAGPPAPLLAREPYPFHPQEPSGAAGTIPLEVPHPEIHDRAQQAPARTVAPGPGEASRCDHDDGDPAIAAARACANQGKLAEAAEWCRKAIAADKLNPAHHYLLASIRQELGEAEAAVQSLTRALYIDPGFALAHFTLANVELSRGRRTQAERHFANALALLQARPYGEPLPESEGLTAGRLVEIVTSILASLPRARAA